MKNNKPHQSTSDFTAKKYCSPVLPIYVQCPQCNKELMDEKTQLDNLPGIKVHVHDEKTTAPLWLSAQYGSFTSIDTLDLREGKTAKLSCPFCSKELPSSGKCSDCDAKLYSLNLVTGGVIGFCSRKSCRNHYLEFQDVKELSLFYESLHLDYSPAP